MFTGAICLPDASDIGSKVIFTFDTEQLNAFLSISATTMLLLQHSKYLPRCVGRLGHCMRTFQTYNHVTVVGPTSFPTKACSSYCQSPSRLYSTDYKHSVVPEPYADLKFVPIYRFPYIRGARILARLKLYQTGLTVIGIPAISYLYSTGQLGLDSVFAAVGVASFAGVMLYVISGYLRKVVGVISLSDRGDIVRIGRLTFWGNRRNVYTPLTDIVPLTDCESNLNDIYVHIRRYSTDDVLYMSLRYGLIVEQEAFKQVFGNTKQ